MNFDKIIPYGRQSLSNKDIEAVIDVLKSDFLTQGPVLPKFEIAVAEKCSASHAVAANSATSALHIACMSLGLGPGDLLWTTPNTFVASANVALYCQAEVDFIDIDPRTYNISLSALTEKLELAKKTNRLPKILVPVHFAGQSPEMLAINKLSKEFGFKIIEDASHGLGATYLTEPVGSCKYSDITVFSFHPVKIITSGEGGMALTNCPSLAEKMRMYRSHGITSDKSLMISRPDDEIWNYQQITIGYNYRMTEIHAALGLSQLNSLDLFVDKRRKIAERYDKNFSNLPIILPHQISASKSSYHLYPVRIRESLFGKNQKKFDKFMNDHGISVNLHYIPVYRQPYYENMGFKAGYCPEAELFHKEVVSLPIFPGMTECDLKRVIEVVEKSIE